MSYSVDGKLPDAQKLRWPFVLRSTYDALKLEREASAQAAKGLYAANIELIETQRRAHETLQQQQGRIEDYKREADAAHNELALALGRGESEHAKRLTADQNAEIAERRRIEAEVRCNEAIARERDWAARYEVLMNRTMQLKLSGAIEVPIAPVPAPAKEQDMIMQAINDVCRGKPPAVKRAMIRQMREDRASDVPDMDILIRIQQGEPNEGVPT